MTATVLTEVLARDAEILKPEAFKLPSFNQDCSLGITEKLDAREQDFRKKMAYIDTHKDQLNGMQWVWHLGKVSFSLRTFSGEVLRYSLLLASGVGTIIRDWDPFTEKEKFASIEERIKTTLLNYRKILEAKKQMPSPWMRPIINFTMRKRKLENCIEVWEDVLENLELVGDPQFMRALETALQHKGQVERNSK